MLKNFKILYAKLFMKILIKNNAMILKILMNIFVFASFH